MSKTSFLTTWKVVSLIREVLSCYGSEEAWLWVKESPLEPYKAKKASRNIQIVSRNIFKCVEMGFVWWDTLLRCPWVSSEVWRHSDLQKVMTHVIMYMWRPLKVLEWHALHRKCPKLHSLPHERWYPLLGRCFHVTGQRRHGYEGRNHH